jgi:hypothetical protein
LKLGLEIGAKQLYCNAISLLDARPEFLNLFKFSILDEVHELKSLQDTSNSCRQFLSGSKNAQEM